jgi:hypothetical protein
MKRERASHLGLALLFIGYGIGQGEEEGGAFAWFAFQPDPAAVKFDDAFYKGKPNAGAFAIGVELFKETEDAFMIFMGNAHAVIADVEDGLVRFGFVSLQTDFDDWVGLVTHVFGGVVDQVLQNLYQTRFISMDAGQVRLSLKRDASLLESPMDDFFHFFY